MGKDGPTDVLAFPIDDEPHRGRALARLRRHRARTASPTELADLPLLLGDVVICPAVAARNAPEHAGTYDDELALLVVHGILHVLGMDHAEDDEADARCRSASSELLDQFHHER